MNIACPYCQAVLKIKALRAGRYTPQCPKCANPFLVVVPADETGTIKVGPIKKQPPAADLPDTVRVPAARPDTDRLPVTSARPPVKTAAPGDDTAVIARGGETVKVPRPRTPPAEPGDVEDAAAALLEEDDADEDGPPAPGTR